MGGGIGAPKWGFWIDAILTAHHFFFFFFFFFFVLFLGGLEKKYLYLHRRVGQSNPQKGGWVGGQHRKCRRRRRSGGWCTCARCLTGVTREWVWWLKSGCRGEESKGESRKEGGRHETQVN
jgi:hypothetical protein